MAYCDLHLVTTRSISSWEVKLFEKALDYTWQRMQEHVHRKTESYEYFNISCNCMFQTFQFYGRITTLLTPDNPFWRSCRGETLIWLTDWLTFSQFQVKTFMMWVLTPTRESTVVITTILNSSSSHSCLHSDCYGNHSIISPQYTTKHFWYELPCETIVWSVAGRLISFRLLSFAYSYFA